MNSATMKPLDPMPHIEAELMRFGASLSRDGFITKGGKVLGVKPVIKAGRLRFESGEGALLASGRPDAAFVAHFLTRFWHWKMEE